MRSSSIAHAAATPAHIIASVARAGRSSMRLAAA